MPEYSLASGLVALLCLLLEPRLEVFVLELIETANHLAVEHNVAAHYLFGLLLCQILPLKLVLVVHYELWPIHIRFIAHVI